MEFEEGRFAPVGGGEEVGWIDAHCRRPDRRVLIMMEYDDTELFGSVFVFGARALRASIDALRAALDGAACSLHAQRGLVWPLPH